MMQLKSWALFHIPDMWIHIIKIKDDNGNPYTGKTISLYWDGPMFPKIIPIMSPHYLSPCKLVKKLHKNLVLHSQEIYHTFLLAFLIPGIGFISMELYLMSMTDFMIQYSYIHMLSVWKVNISFCKIPQFVIICTNIHSDMIILLSKPKYLIQKFHDMHALYILPVCPLRVDDIKSLAETDTLFCAI